MTNDGTEEDLPRKRSNSLPVPKIEVSLYQSPETKRREAASRDAPPPSPEPKYSGEFMASPTGGPLHKRSASERGRKGKTRMADFRAFVETKLKSRSQTMLERLSGDGRRGSASGNYPVGDCHASFLFFSFATLHFGISSILYPHSKNYSIQNFIPCQV
ncbi:Protein unc-80 [Amphibalanus amphitrite]|uniref:Protein unc-80 n=1 Tax=Amphibalanus amphitrite TaxID=1232801 RepID=A0A6A4V5F9_AMPAM|nr:Protein unc-80 [Amphibalanus amphitrite]